MCDTIRKLSVSERNARITGLAKNEVVVPGSCVVRKRNRKTTTRADAGVGSPLKWLFCVVSRLNVARRSAEKAGIKKGQARRIHWRKVADPGWKRGSCLMNSFSIKRNMKIPGATPKLTTSARESSSFPRSEYALSRRATRPSRKSNNAQRKII